MKNPRIAIVRQTYNPAGGAERFVSRALAALAQEKADISLITRKWEQFDGFKTIQVNPFYMGNVWREAGFVAEATRVIREAHFDLVQSHERMAECDIFRAGDGVHRAWLAHRSRALSSGGRLALKLNPYHHYVCDAEAKLFASPRLKKVICNSLLVKREIQHYFDVPDEKIALMYNGVDTQHFHPKWKADREQTRLDYGLPLDRPLFLHVGSGFERKGVARSLEALARSHTEAGLWVVGKDKHLKKYQQLAHTLKIQHRVFFSGALPNVEKIYGAADAFILPTLYDPFPNGVVEAMASGLPVLTSHQCGGAEWIVENQEGRVWDALEIEGFAEGIRWLSDPAVAAAAGQAARRRAEPFTLDKMAQALLGLYQTVI